MIPVQRISIPPWMQSDETRAVMDALDDGKDAPAALFVGGCVRNTLLNRPVSDIDIATRWTPGEVMTRLDAAGLKTIPTGLAHGTVTAVSGARTFEITTLRRDVDTDGRHATVAFTDDWLEDAKRRDFTMNTLLVDHSGAIFDPTGEGVSDLNRRRVRFVGDPAQRIAEDYLRILRFFRFHAQVGEGPADRGALSACRAAAGKIATLSRERVTQEFLKILAVPHPSSVLSLMFGEGVLGDLPDPAYDPDVMGRLPGDANIESRLFVLGGMAALDFDRHLILSNARKKTLNAIGLAYRGLKDLCPLSIKKAVYFQGNAAAVQAVFLFAAANNLASDEPALALARSWAAPQLPVKGDDLLNASVPAGPSIGAKLHALEEKWIENNFVWDEAWMDSI